MASDYFIKDFTTIKLSSTDDEVVYGMVGFGGNDIGPKPPELLLIYIFKDGYVIMAEKFLSNSHELPDCRLVFDHAINNAEIFSNLYRQSAMTDTNTLNKSFSIIDKGWEDYCQCYKENLKKEAFFNDIVEDMRKLRHSILN